MMKFHYQLDGAGWLTGTIGDGNRSVSMDATYHHDTFKELLEAVVFLLRGGPSASVEFFFEKGSYLLLLNKPKGEYRYRIRKYDDDGTGLPLLKRNRKFNAVMRGSFDLGDFARSVLRESEKLLSQYGETGYRERAELPFPMNTYKELLSLVEQLPEG